MKPTDLQISKKCNSLPLGVFTDFIDRSRGAQSVLVWGLHLLYKEKTMQKQRGDLELDRKEKILALEQSG